MPIQRRKFASRPRLKISTIVAICRSFAEGGASFNVGRDKRTELLSLSSEDQDYFFDRPGLLNVWPGGSAVVGLVSRSLIKSCPGAPSPDELRQLDLDNAIEAARERRRAEEEHLAALDEFKMGLW